MRSTNRELIFAYISAALFAFDFKSISYRTEAADGFQRCLMPFLRCYEWPLPTAMPGSYANGFLFAAVLGWLVFTFWQLLRDNRKLWLASLSGLLLFKVFYNFIWHFSELQNFDFFHLFPLAAFLLNSRDRLGAARLMWVLLLSFSAMVKLTDAWIVGSYFSNLKLGLPLFPDWSIPFVTNGVILFEILGSLALLTRRWAKPAFWTWVVFHVYSAILVGFTYPVRCLAVLFALFFNTPFADRARWQLGWSTRVLMGVFVILQLLPRFYAEDPHRTLRFEGYMFNMFQANYQCSAEFEFFDSGQKRVRQMTENSARKRCSPFHYLQRAQHLCRRTTQPVSLKLDQSLDGQPFYRIVDLTDACSAKASLFGANPWLRGELESILVGYPDRNAIFGPPTQRGSTVFFEPKVAISPVQMWLRAHLVQMQTFYFAVWILTGLAFLKRRSR